MSLRNPSDAAADLLSLFAAAVNVVDGTIGNGVGQGATVGFAYTNPVDGKRYTETGYTLTNCPPPNITAFRGEDGRWYLVGRAFARQLQTRLIQLRRKRPDDAIDDRVLVGYLFTKMVPGETAVHCPSPDPPGAPDPEDDLPPKDPDYPHADKGYSKTWIADIFTSYPDEVNHWLFGGANCGLPINTVSSSMGWLPDLPHEPFYEGLYVSTWAPYLYTLYESPSLSAPQWHCWQQTIGKSVSGGFNQVLVIIGVAKSFLGDSAPGMPPALWIYFGSGIDWQPLSSILRDPYRVLGNSARKECAPRLAPAPQPPTPPPKPPNPGDRQSVQLWFHSNKRKTPLLLKTLSAQETLGKGDIVWLGTKQVLVICKYGNAKYDGAPNTIDRGYCRLSIFKIPGDAGAPFTESALRWDLVQAGAAFSLLLELGVAQKNLFIKALSTCSFYADDAVGYLAMQPNPLYAAWIKAGSLRANLLTCGARQLRNLSKSTANARVYLPDPYPASAPAGTVKDWRSNAYYATPPIVSLATAPQNLPMRCLSLQFNPFFDRNLPESETNPRDILLSARQLDITKFKLPAAGGVLMTIACAPVDERLLR